MSSGAVREDGSAVSRADRALFRVESALTLASGLFIMGVMLLSVANILGRKLFNLPVDGYIDWMIQAVPVMAFLGISYVQRLGGHIRMDIVVRALKGRALWVVEFIGILVMFLIALALIYGTWNHASRAFRLGDSTTDINLPIWPVKAMVTLMLMLFAVRCALQLWAYARAIRTGEDEPVAVPLIEDAAAQARHEAETVSGFDEEEGPA
jgi:TRAP-type mannitol/chloroaromatic compound transport system permease small subunit